MLFDLRGRGRRRTIQAIYLTLAILMGGGLVLFGIGGDVQGGLFDAFRENSAGTSADQQLQERIERVEERLRADPRNERALAELARLRVQAAGVGEGFDQSTGTFTQEGRDDLRAAARAWERYLALEPENPDPRVAALLVQALGPAGLNQLDKAVRAQEIVTEQREPPNENLFAQLAVLAYQAGQIRKGDLAADRAVELADESERSLLRDNLEQAKAQAAALQAQQAAPGGTTTTP